MLTKILELTLSFARRHESPSEAAFVASLMKLLPVDRLVSIDTAGNIIYKQGDSKTLFVAHLDTVHLMNEEKVDWEYTDNKKFIRLKKGAQASCLGADDGAGIALLAHMLDAGVPGTYLFTRGEEMGRISSSFIRVTRPEWLTQFDRAIQFDRRGTNEVITHQRGIKCASPDFAESLCKALNQTCSEFQYKPSKLGSSTDVRMFFDIIPECVNIACGYSNAHRRHEVLDMQHFSRLAQAVTKIGWESLKVKR